MNYAIDALEKINNDNEHAFNQEIEKRVKFIIRTKNETEKKKTTDKISTSRDDLEQIVFMVDSAGNAKKVQVQTGIQDDKFIEITSTLSEKIKIISGPYSAISRTLKDKDKLLVVDKSKLYEK